MCRRPLAYGQATATRIFLGVTAPVTGANDRECPSCDPSAGGEERSAENQGEHGSDPHRRKVEHPRQGRGVGVAVRLDERGRSAPHGIGDADGRCCRSADDDAFSCPSSHSDLRSALRRCRGPPASVRSIGRLLMSGRHLRVDARIGGPRGPCHRRGNHSGIDGRRRRSRDRRGAGLGDDHRRCSDRLGWCDGRSRRLGRRWSRFGSSGTRRRLLSGRWRRGRRSRRRGWGGRRRGCRRRVGSSPRRKQAEWVDVGVLADPNAEMDVRNRMFSLARWPGIGDRVDRKSVV